MTTGLVHNTSFGPVSCKHGAETTTHYSNGLLNRVSFLREDQEFLKDAFNSEDARFLLFDNLAPKIETLSEGGHRLFGATRDQVKDIIGAPYDQSSDDLIKSWNPTRDASGINSALVVFLGLDQSQSHIKVHDDYSGQPWFAVDTSVKPDCGPELKERLKALDTEISMNENVKTVALRSIDASVQLPTEEYGVFAEARMLLDWNNRVRFCAGCGSRLMSTLGGHKLVCPPLSPEHSCPTHGVLTNLTFPRTDCSIISAVINREGTKLLLGRSKRFPPGLYSCLAGFLEPGESIEDCVRREIWEEAGVTVGRVSMHSSQPWPFPANIMLGCIAEIADSSEASHEIHLGHDKELEDARWVDLKDVAELLRSSVFDGNPQKLSNDEVAKMMLPPPSTIANVLLTAVCNGHLNQKL